MRQNVTVASPVTTAGEVCGTFKNINPRKAVDPDRIRVKVLKECMKQLGESTMSQVTTSDLFICFSLYYNCFIVWFSVRTDPCTNAFLCSVARSYWQFSSLLKTCPIQWNYYSKKVITLPETCVRPWTITYKNNRKTELLFMPGKDCPQVDLLVTTEDIEVSPPPTVRNLAVVLDDQLSCNANITSVARSSRIALYNICSIWPFPTCEAAQILVQALLAGLPGSAIKHLQRIKNAVHCST